MASTAGVASGEAFPALIDSTTEGDETFASLAFFASRASWASMVLSGSAR